MTFCQKWYFSLSLQLLHQSKNPLTPGAFCEKCVFWTFWWFLGWISAKLASIWSKMYFATSPLALLATSMRRNQNSGRESDLRLKAFRFLEIFFRLSFFFFSFLFAACLRLKNFQESVIETGNLYHGVARCSGRKFCSEFFTQLFEHFCAYLRLHSADHSDLGIIRKIFSSCRS